MPNLKLLLLTVLSVTPFCFAQFEPTWPSLDNRTLPTWYDQAKIGIFLHWGVYSVPSYLDAWFWYHWQGDTIPEYVDFMSKNYPPTWTYPDFGPQFTAEFFNPSDWADLFAASGAKYVVLTSKHHEGYTLWPSKFAFGWNSMDVGPKRDLVGDLAKEVRNKKLHFGLYYSLLEFFNPFYLEDKANEWKTSSMPDLKSIPELKSLVETYEPELIWSDGDWEAPDTYWKSTEFLAWLYNESPVKDFVVVNDRWGGNGVQCKHGGFLTCSDRYSPGHLMDKKWENAMTIDKSSWAYRRDAKASDIMTIEELIALMAETISYGGNLLINVGPTKEGTIVPVFQERLLQLGEWLGQNGEAIYESSVWENAQNDTVAEGVWYTKREESIYGIVLNWPKGNEVVLESVKGFSEKGVEISMLGNKGVLESEILDNGVKIKFPNKAAVVGKWGWVLKFTPNKL